MVAQADETSSNGLPEKAIPDHEANGKFAIGNRGGPGEKNGSPKKAWRKMLDASFVRCLDEDSMDRMVMSMIAAASTGDVAAFKELMNRACGRDDLNITKTVERVVSPETIEMLTRIAREQQAKRAELAGRN